MAKKYADNNDSAEAWRSRMDQQEDRWRRGEESDPKLAALIERDADAAMERAIRKWGRD